MENRLHQFCEIIFSFEMSNKLKHFTMKKDNPTSKKSLDSLKGKKLGDLKTVYAGLQSSSELTLEDSEMANCITIMNNGGTADDSSWDRKK